MKISRGNNIKPTMCTRNFCQNCATIYLIDFCWEKKKKEADQPDTAEEIQILIEPCQTYRKISQIFFTDRHIVESHLFQLNKTKKCTKQKSAHEQFLVRFFFLIIFMSKDCNNYFIIPHNSLFDKYYFKTFFYIHFQSYIQTIIYFTYNFKTFAYFLLHIIQNIVFIR